MTRDEPPNPRDDAGEAVSHYAERFRDTFQDLGQSISDAGRQLSDWLRKTHED